MLWQTECSGVIEKIYKKKGVEGERWKCAQRADSLGWENPLLCLLNSTFFHIGSYWKAGVALQEWPWMFSGKNPRIPHTRNRCQWQCMGAGLLRCIPVYDWIWSCELWCFWFFFKFYHACCSEECMNIACVHALRMRKRLPAEHELLTQPQGHILTWAPLTHTVTLNISGVSLEGLYVWTQTLSFWGLSNRQWHQGLGGWMLRLSSWVIGL